MKYIKYIVLISGVFLILLGCFLNSNLIVSSKNPLDGKWLEESGGLFVIEDDSFYWYKDYNDLSNNYYRGKIEYKTLDQYNYTDTYIKENYGSIHPELFYIIKVYPDSIIKNNKEEKVNSSYPLVFELLLEENKLGGSLYNKNFLTIYNIIKYGN